MIFGVMLDTNEKEKQVICKYLSDLTAHATEERLEIKTFHNCDPLMRQLEEKDLLDVAIIDVTLPDALEKTRDIRRKYAKTEILVIADNTVSPMQYMHPSIRASSLLLRPMTNGWRQAVKDFFDQMLRKNNKELQKNVLWIDSHSGAFRIPMEQIYYLEAREKKVFIRLRAEEFCINSTLERLTEQLPDNFLRCHRSYIVNTDYIFQIKLSESMLYLSDGLFVPISRSYKETFKRHLNE